LIDGRLTALESLRQRLGPPQQGTFDPLERRISRPGKPVFDEKDRGNQSAAQVMVDYK